MSTNAFADALTGIELDGRFRRDGSVRIFGFGTSSFALPDLVGFRYLARLLGTPGVDVSAWDLVRLEKGLTVAPQSGIEAIDDSARRAYRQRVAELDEEIAAADVDGDHGRSDAAAHERAFLLAELGRSVGRRGVRSTGDGRERARTSVYRSLHYGLGRIADRNPLMAAHLRRGLTTGLWCRYDPDPLCRVRWDVA